MSYYILEGKKPKRINDCDAWERWKQTADRQVALTTVGNVVLSTVFLGYPAICQGYLDGVVKLFETILFVEENSCKSILWYS